VTGGRGTRVGGANGFDDNHGAEFRPFGQCRKSGAVRHGPDPAPPQTAMLVIEGIRAMLAGAPGSLMFEVCMEGLVDCLIGLFVITFQGSPRVACLVPARACAGRLTAHGIDGHPTALDSQKVQQCRHGRHRVGRGIGFDLSQDEATLLGTPGGDHRQGGRGRGPIPRRFHGLALHGDERPRRALGDGLRPGHKTRLKALRVQAGKDAAKGIRGGNAMGQSQPGLEPGLLALAKEFHGLEAFPAGQEGAYSDDQDIEEVMLLRPRHAGVLSGAKMLDNRRVHRCRHAACSSA